MKYFVEITLLTALLIPSAALSAPDKYTGYVMNTPVSLHDFAIYQVNNVLEKIFEGMFFKPYGNVTDENFSSSMEYDFDSNLYTINIYGFIPQKLRNKQANYDLADKLINTVKNHLGLHQTTVGQKYTLTFYKSSLLSRLMTHSGYCEKNEPENLAQEIDKKIRIHLEFSLADSNVFECVSNDIFSAKIMCSSN